MQTATGTYRFTYPLRTAGHVIAEFEARVRYEVRLPRRPFSRDPQDDEPELLSVSEPEVDVGEVHGGRALTLWMEPDQEWLGDELVRHATQDLADGIIEAALHDGDRSPMVRPLEMSPAVRAVDAVVSVMEGRR